MNSWACTSAGGAVHLTSIELQNVINKLSQELWRKAVQMQQAQAKGAKGSIKSSKLSFELDDIYVYIYIFLLGHQLLLMIWSKTNTSLPLHPN
jgi:hypothetical protein